MSGSLADHLSAIEVQRFVGRDRELEVLDELLVPESPARIAFVHGPGGIGKSTLLSAFGRRAESAGSAVRKVDARRLDRAPESLERAIAGIGDSGPTVLIIDTFEQVTGLGGHLRQQLLPSLPAETRVVIASRHAPEPDWRRDGWGAVLREVSLGPLPVEDARRLLEVESIEDAALAARVVEWAGGEPLAITLAAEALRADPETDPAKLGSDERIAGAIVRQIGDEETRGSGREVLLVAAVARSVDAKLLEAVIEGTDGRTAVEWLESLSFSEPYGGRLTLHERMRPAIRAVEKKLDPAAERSVRSRVADHLDRRIRAGESDLIAEMTSLIEDPVVRWGFDGGDIHRADIVRDGDLDTAAALAGERTTSPLWPGVERFFEEAPERVVVARDDSGRMLGFSIAVTPVNRPEWATEDPWLGPWLTHAAAEPDHDVVLWRDTFDFSDPGPADGSSVVALLNAATTICSGLPNPRYFYGPVDSEDQAAAALSRAIGAVHLPDLDLPDSTGTIECHRFDHGPGGMLETIRTLVKHDAGGELHTGPSSRPTPDDAVRAALRHFHNPAKLAENPLAEGTERRDRASDLRSKVEQTIEHGFGESDRETLLRRTLQLGYIDPDADHDSAAHALHLSRSTYFRRLREATDRLVDRFPGRHH